MKEFYPRKKKICQMCAGKSVDYKDVPIITKYINEKGKILPRRNDWCLCITSKTYS